MSTNVGEATIQRVLNVLPMPSAPPIDNFTVADLSAYGSLTVRLALSELRRRNLVIGLKGGERGRKLWRRV